MSISAIDGSDISIERAHSVEPQHRPCSSPSLDDGTSYAPLSRLKTIEMRQEMLHHVQMAWRAQQRLVKRCLDLYPSSGGTQSAEINNLDCDIISLSGKNGGKWMELWMLFLVWINSTKNHASTLKKYHVRCRKSNILYQLFGLIINHILFNLHHPYSVLDHNLV